MNYQNNNKRRYTMAWFFEMLKNLITKVRNGLSKLKRSEKDFSNIKTMIDKDVTMKEAWDTLSFAGFLLYLIMYTVIGYFVCVCLFYWFWWLGCILMFILGETLTNIIFIPLLKFCVILMYICKYILLILGILLVVVLLYWVLQKLFPNFMHKFKNLIVKIGQSIKILKRKQEEVISNVI